MDVTDPTNPELRETRASADHEQTVDYVVVGELRAEGDDDTCLRPLGLCELGGACDSCWYRPDHPRFHNP